MATFAKGSMMTDKKRIEPGITNSDIIIMTPLCNDLLANILRGIVYANPDEVIMDVIDDNFNPEEVYQARLMIFKNFSTLFPNDSSNPTEDRSMGMKEKEIKKMWHIQDILEKIHVIHKIDHDIEFCVPWNYRYVIMTEEEKRFREIVGENDEMLHAKFDSLEKTINLQNRATIMAVEKVMKESIETVKDVVTEKKIEGVESDTFEDAEFFKGISSILLEHSSETFHRICSNNWRSQIRIHDPVHSKPL